MLVTGNGVRIAYLGMAASSCCSIPVFSRHVTLFPPQGCSSRVAYRRIAIYHSPRGRACDVCNNPCEWHLNILLAFMLLLPVSAANSLHSSWAVSRAAVPNCSLLRDARLERHDPISGVPL
jgi:hypothetical protein